MKASAGWTTYGTLTSRPLLTWLAKIALIYTQASIVWTGEFMARIVKGQVVALFAFDVGYEVSLERLSAMLATAPVQPLSRKKQTPTYMQYSKPPQILSLGLATGHFAVAGSIQATIFDFGAVSIAYRWPIGQGNEMSLEDLPQVSHDLYNLDLGFTQKSKPNR